MHFAKGEWVGVEFEEENLGDHDGIVQGVRYFQARPKSALFVRPPQVMVSAPAAPSFPPPLLRFCWQSCGCDHRSVLRACLLFAVPQLFQEGEKAALAVQNASRKLLAKRRALKERSSSVWNKLDNFNEHLAIQR